MQVVTASCPPSNLHIARSHVPWPEIPVFLIRNWREIAQGWLSIGPSSTARNNCHQMTSSTSVSICLHRFMTGLCPVSTTVVLCPPRKVPDSLTEEFPRVSRGEGRPQDRAQHNIELQFPPPCDELSAVHLGEERGDDMEAVSMPGASQLHMGVHQALHSQGSSSRKL